MVASAIVPVGGVNQGCVEYWYRSKSSSLKGRFWGLILVASDMDVCRSRLVDDVVWFV